MARNKEALILLIDVGPSMHKLLPEVEKICSMLLIFGKYDEVGVVLFATDDTDNELTTEVGGYEHVVVLRNCKVVDGDIIEALQSLPRGAAPVLDAIVVGMDMMIKKFGQTSKGKKRLCLITDAKSPIKDPYEGTKEDQVDTVAAQMNAHGMKLESIIVRGRSSGDAAKGFMEENDSLLVHFSKKASAKTVYVESPTSLLGAIRTRNISPVTTFRGDLELSPKMKIKVWVYKKTAEEKFPTLKKYSDKAPPTDKFATHEIKVDYEYKGVEDPTKVIPPEQRIKGYRYGPQVVPISSDEWDAVKFKPEKSVKLLGFTDASNIMRCVTQRHYYMKDVSIFIAEPGNGKATLAVSALVRAMAEMNKVAILRCVWRQGQASLVVGALTPNPSNVDNIPDSFYFNVLPFAEDFREFQFPSFSNLPLSMQPNEKQQEAADNLVMMLDLAPPGKEETLRPEFTPNPVLERFYRVLEIKSKKPDAEVPPLDTTLKRITEPDPELFQAIKKSARRLLNEKPSSSHKDELEGAVDALGHQAVLSLKNESSQMVDKVGSETPIEDFEAMMTRKGRADWVDKAIKDMKNLIFDLVENSYEGNTYQKAVDCLVALRKGCILEQEPKQFNDFLRHLCKFCSEKYLSSFCNFLASQQMRLISDTESSDSDVTDEEAGSFLVKTEPGV
ncbi:hypothetical protein C5167_048703 [Papaver somniferum]|uniref:ATP-dependent DNA helicase 2 subunit KU80 n=1 Tax=Papaver somniferum TaxID=3469 RepID=A0A4Y7KM24_PAPSO|nr:hypothetical protein C5167_048703 [Papaver somniferum]